MLDLLRVRRITAALGCIIVLGSHADAACPPDFGSPTYTAVSPSPQNLVVVDLDHDGHLDVVVASQGGPVVVAMGAPTPGDFLPTFSLGVTALDLVAADFNHDGLVDLATANGSSGVTVFLATGTNGPGTINYGAATTYGSIGARAISTADFDGDAILDLCVTSTNCPSSVVILRGLGAGGSGDGQFQTAGSYPGGCSLLSVTAGDVDGDHLPDVVASEYYSGQLDVFLNRSSAPGTFSTVSKWETGDYPSKPRIADVSGDGLADLVVGTLGKGEVLLVGSGASPGTFAPFMSIANYSAASSAVADLDLDGDPDVLVVGNQGDLVALVNEGFPTHQASFVGIRLNATAVGGSCVDLGDVNQDGRTDAVIGLQSTARFGSYVAQCGDPSKESPRGGRWTANGIPVCTAAGVQSQVAVCDDNGSGATFVTWADRRGGTESDIYAQRVDADGHASWAPDGIVVTNAVKNQASPQIVSDLAGGVYVGWLDSRSGVATPYLQHLDASGAVVAGWPANGLAVNGGATAAASRLKVVGDGNGGAFLAALDSRIVCYRIKTDGTPATGWTSSGVMAAQNVYYQDPPPYFYYYRETLYDLSACRSSDGGLWLGWYIDIQGSSFNERFELGLVQVSGAGAVGSTIRQTAETYQYVAPILVTGAGGGAYEFFRLSNTLRPAHIVGTTGAGLQINANALSWTAASAQTSGIFAWTQPSSYATSVYAVRMQSNGTSATGWPTSGALFCDSPGFINGLTSASDPFGGAMLAWADGGMGNSDIRVQYIEPSGVTHAPWTSAGVRVCAESHEQTTPALVFVNPLAAVIAWQDKRADGGDVYAQRIDTDMPVAVQLSLENAGFVDGFVRIRWAFLSDGGFGGWVERTEDGFSWSRRSAPAIEGGTHLVFEDRDVVRGQRYGYRLRSGQSSDVFESPTVWIDVPAVPRLAIHGVRPNPITANGATLMLEVPNSAPARVEMIDLAGRVPLRQEVAVGIPGAISVKLRTEGLSPGVYWLRVVQSGSSVRQRMVVLK